MDIHLSIPQISVKWTVDWGRGKCIQSGNSLVSLASPISPNLPLLSSAQNTAGISNVYSSPAGKMVFTVPYIETATLSWASGTSLSSQIDPFCIKTNYFLLLRFNRSHHFDGAPLYCFFWDYRLMNITANYEEYTKNGNTETGTCLLRAKILFYCFYSRVSFSSFLPPPLDCLLKYLPLALTLSFPPEAASWPVPSRLPHSVS